MKKMQDLAAERAVLAGLCQYGIDSYLEVDFLESSHFDDPINQMLFRCVTDCIKKGATVELSAIMSRAIELGCSDIFEKDDEIAFIRSLFNFPVKKNNVGIYAAKLAKGQIISTLQRTLNGCVNTMDKFTGDEDISTIINTVESALQKVVGEIYSGADSRPKLIGDGIDEYLQNLIDNPNSVSGIPSGFPDYDKSIGGGLRRKCVDLIGARTKVGKSLFADAVALNVSLKQGIPVLMLDTEMDSDDHKNRILANISDVTLDDIRVGTFIGDTIKEPRLWKAAELIKNMPYSYKNVAGQTFEYILSIARQWIYQVVGFDEAGRTNNCLIIFDYLKMMSSEDMATMQEYQALGFQMTSLHNFCVKYDVPCLSFIQLNRDGITKESTDVASGSDRIMWLCTSFTILKEKSVEEQVDDRAIGLKVPYTRKLVPIISRHGGGLDTGDYINVRMQGEFARLTQGPTRNKVVRSNGREIENVGPIADIGTV